MALTVPEAVGALFCSSNLRLRAAMRALMASLAIPEALGISVIELVGLNDGDGGDDGDGA